MRILFFGDIVGRPGRKAVAARLSSLRAALGLDLVIANAENASGGLGLSAQGAAEVLGSGVEVITSGNHIWRYRDLVPVLDQNPRLLRPANYPAGAPGKGLTILDLTSGRASDQRVAILNLQGRTFMDPIDCPFAAADRLLAEIPDEVRIRILDFHAEATSEKIALGLYLDGRISALVGTHTHVQTTDARILPGGTAFLSDAGMCGPLHSCLGMDPAAILKKFRTGLPQRFEVAKGPAILQGVIFDIDEASGRATDIRLLNEAED